jgi:AraC-like DNA-binding protein
VSVAVEGSRSSALWDKFAAESSDWFSTRFEFQLLGPVAFAPQFEFYPGDGVSVSRGVMPALRVTNHGSSWPDPFFQIARADQESVFAMAGYETLRLAPGELVICRPDIAGEWTIDRPYTTAALHIDERLFRRYIPNPMDLVGTHLELPEAVSDILSRIMDTSLALARQGRFGTTGRSLACSFLNMLALTPRVQVPEDREESSAVDFRRAQIKTFIQENYAKPGLSTEDIANHLEITPRYVQIALASEGLTPTEYLKVCRLQAARRLLSSAAFADRSITEIAFECGFTSSAHFSTEFRKCFGKSPRSFRRSPATWRAGDSQVRRG